MGGRKSYSNKNYLGGSQSVKKEVKKLDEFFDSKESPRNIAAQNIKLATVAKKPLEYSIYSLKLFSEVSRDIKKLKGIKDKNILKEEISKKWSRLKKESKIRLEKEAEKTIIESAVKSIGGWK